jgi:hypothetical protein
MDPDVFTLTNGIKLSLKDASPMHLVMLRDQSEADEPKPPMITRADRGDRQEPNEDDPAYKAAKAKWAMQMGTRTVSILAAECITVDEVPDGIPKYDSEEWATHVTVVLQFDLPDNPTLRLVQWLLLKTTADDLEDLARRLLAHAGAPEVDVEAALDTFQGYRQRPADTEGAANGRRADGDTVQVPAPRNRAERRRAASR